MSRPHIAARIKDIDVTVGRQKADELLARYGLMTPPLDVDGLVSTLGYQIQVATDQEIDQLEVLTIRQKQLWKKIRAALHAETNTIYLRANLAAQEKITAILHEIAHDQIEWHADLLRNSSIDPRGLAEELRVQMEAEATAFALRMRLLGDQFHTEIGPNPDLNEARLLIKRYKLSSEMGLRAYQENKRHRSVLIFIDECQGLFKLRSYEKCGDCFIPFPAKVGEYLPGDHPIVVTIRQCELDVLELVEQTSRGRRVQHQVWADGKTHYVLSRYISDAT